MGTPGHVHTGHAHPHAHGHAAYGHTHLHPDTAAWRAAPDRFDDMAWYRELWPPRDSEEPSVEEQADDAAALLDALGLVPAAVFGTSSGAVFTLGLLVGHPQAVRGAILHEPAVYTLADDPAGMGNSIAALVSEGMAAGGPPVALERFWRFVAGDANWEKLDGG